MVKLNVQLLAVVLVLQRLEEVATHQFHAVYLEAFGVETDFFGGIKVRCNGEVSRAVHPSFAEIGLEVEFGMQHFHVERTTRAVIVVYMRDVYIGIRGFSHFYDGFVAVAAEEKG
jgi:hypothetical protein